MRIQNIQQNNNTKFQGLYGSKVAKARCYLSPLRSEMKNLAKKYDVLVQVDKLGIFLSSVLSTSLGILGSAVGFITTFSLSTAIATGVGTMLTMILLIEKAFMDFQVQIGEKIKKDNNTGRWKFDGYSRYNNYVRNKKDLERLENTYLNNCQNTSNIKFAKVQLTKDRNGNLPLHKINTINRLRGLNNYLKNDIKDLSKIYLTRNNKGELPIHNPNIMQNPEALQNIMETFKNYPRLLVTIFEAKNQQGESVLDVLQKLEGGEEQYLVERIFKHVQEAKEHCIKKDGVFVPILSKTEREANTKLNNMMTSEVDFQNIMNILKYKDCQDTRGYLLNNSVYITNIMDFVLNEASKDEKKAIIKELQKLPNIDYNKVDENNISVAEKIMNAEDFELLKLLDGKKLNYYPELDYAFERIENRDFKKRVEAFNFEFKDLEQAVRMKSMRSLAILEKQFSSPLFKKEYNGDILLNEVGTENSSFAEQFLEKYGQYLSDYII